MHYGYLEMDHAVIATLKVEARLREEGISL